MIESGRSQDEILSAYVDILNTDGPESRRELSYLRKYADDPETLTLLRGARAVKALFEAFGDFPDVSPRPTRSKTSRRVRTTRRIKSV